MMNQKEIWLIRHGETDFNASYRWQGHLPTDLNGVGRQQATMLAKFLSGKFSGEICASDLPRAKTTATIIGKHLNIQVNVDQRFREIDVGVFQGLTRLEIQEYYPVEYEAWLADLAYAIPRGESRQELRTRIFAGLDERMQHSQTQQIMIVTHGGVVRNILERVSGASNRIENTSITRIDIVDNQWKLIDIGITPHLSTTNADS